MSSQFIPENARKRLTEIVEKIHAEADLELLNQYRAIFKKEISFFKRSSVAAYLLMEADQKGGGRSGTLENRSRGSGRMDAQNEGRRTDTKGYPLSEAESTRLFISVGRSRRIYPREILGLIISNAPVSREDVGIIRILDNYSFVQVRAAKAAEIIDALKGITFRGRPLTVNYARSRKTEDSELPAELQADFPPETDGPADPALPPEQEEYSAAPLFTEIPAEEPAESTQEGDDHTGKEGV